MPGPFPAGHKMVSTDLNPVVLGWVDFLAWFGSTLAYVSADAPTFVFSVDADVTGVVEPGMRVRLTQTTDKFFVVTAVGAFLGGVTPITVYGGTDYVLANAAISAGAFSTHKKPYGFNASPIKWTEALKDTTRRAVATPTASSWFNAGSLSLSIPIGAWDVIFECNIDGDQSSGTADVFSTLSTTNNSETDTDFTSYFFVQATGATATSAVGTSIRKKHLLVVAKTSYFANIKTSRASASSIDFGNADSPLVVRAVCAYL